MNALLGLNCISKCKTHCLALLDDIGKTWVYEFFQYLSIAEGTLRRGGDWDGLDRFGLFICLVVL